MSLSCDCDYDPEPGDVVWEHPNGFSTLTTKRFRKCVSCNTLLKPGNEVVKFYRHKIPETDIECRIYDEDYDYGPPRSTKYMCEECGGLYFSLDELNFCISIYDNMKDLVKEYAEMKSWENEKKKND